MVLYRLGVLYSEMRRIGEARAALREYMSHTAGMADARTTAVRRAAADELHRLENVAGED